MHWPLPNRALSINEASPRCRQTTAASRRGPAARTAAAFSAMMLALMSTVIEAASSGAKGAARRIRHGSARFSHAPSATGMRTT